MLHDLNPFLYWLRRPRRVEQLRVPVAHLWLLLPRSGIKTLCDVCSIGSCLVGSYLSELRRDFLASVGITVGPSSFLQNHV